MYEVMLWVPTKGWKLIRKFRTLDKARECRDEFLPLETRLSGPVPSYILEHEGFCHARTEFLAS